MNPTWDRARTQNEIAATRVVVLSMCLLIVWIGSVLFTGAEVFA